MNLSKSQYIMLVGLKAMASKLDEQLATIHLACAEIMGEQINYAGDGWSGELVYTSRDLDDILRCAKITIEMEGSNVK